MTNSIRLNILTILILSAITLTPQSAAAVSQCFAAAASEKIRTHCIVSEANDKTFLESDARKIDAILKSMGFRQGIGLEYDAEPLRKPLEFGVSPLIYHDDNVNGGNQNDTLQIGNLAFQTDDRYARESGLLVGASAHISGRKTYGPGDFFDYKYSASLASTTTSSYKVKSHVAQLCSINHIYKWWYVDLCLASTKSKKSLTESQSNAFSIATSKSFKAPNNTYALAQIGVRKLKTKQYSQNQIFLGYETIFNDKSRINYMLSIGENVQQHHATKMSLSTSIGFFFNKTPIKLTATYAKANGSRLLGVERYDIFKAIRLDLPAPIFKNVQISLGYKFNNSSIDYFDAKTPFLEVYFSPVSVF